MISHEAAAVSEAGVARMQYERDVLACLKNIKDLVQAHGMSWELDSFYEIERIALEHLDGEP